MIPLASGQYPGAQRLRIGDAVVTALSDGYIDLGPQTVPGATADDLALLVASPYALEEGYRSSISAFLVESGGRRILIDAGGAQSGIGTLGRMQGVLAAIGVGPDTIDALVMTHLHPDHAGGAFDASGAAVFGHAEMILRVEEHAFWHDDAPVNDGNRAYFDLARKAAGAYARGGRLTLFDRDREVMPGLHAEFLPGHTPGHTGYRVESGGEALLIWGDIVHIPPVQMKRPGIGIAFDVEGAQAEATRRAVLERAASDRLKIAGMHLPFPAFGSVARDGEGYRFLPAPYDHEPGHP